VNTEHELTATDTLPKQLTLLHTVKSGRCTSVCNYQGTTYVGLNCGVAIIEEQNQSSRQLLKMTSNVDSVVLYKDRLFTLVDALKNSDPRTVTVCNLTGKLITSWTHSNIKKWCCTKLAVVNDQVLIPDIPNRRLIVYSLAGEVEKHINCPLHYSASSVSVCAVDDDSVIVSDFGSSKVLKVKISNGEVEWTSVGMTKSQGVAYYRGRVYVANCSTHTRIWILDGNTG